MSTIFDRKQFCPVTGLAQQPKRVTPGALDLDDEPGLLPIIDSIVVEAESEIAEAPPASPARLLSTAEVAVFFRRDARTLYRWRQRGLIDAVQIGQAVFYVAADVERLIRSRLTSDILRASGTTGSRATELSERKLRVRP